MPPLEILRLIAPPLLALLAAVVIDRMTARRGLDPPGFAAPWRRLSALFLVAAPLWVGLFYPLVNMGEAAGTDFSQVGYARLFALQILLASVVAGWYVLGFAGFGVRSGPFSPWAQLGLRARRPLREIGLGLLGGVALWAFVLCVLIAVAGAVYLLGGEDALPKAAPATISFIAGLPAVVRLLLSLSAGVVEEIFFRGFLQPRVGITLSTIAFVLAHVAYGQPFMLVGVTLLSLLFALLVRWRQNLWPAIAAHALFDAVQLLVVIPAALKFIESAAPAPLEPLAALAALAGLCVRVIC